LILQEKAKQVAATLKIQNFATSDEAASAPIEKLPEFHQSLQNETSNYDLVDIYNCDEMALYWLLESSKSLTHSRILGVKKPKNHLLLQNQIAVFDESNLTNQPPDSVTIYDAIQFVLQAWNKVSEDVIIHLWQKTGILPSTEIDEYMDSEFLVDLTNEDEIDEIPMVKDIIAEMQKNEPEEESDLEIDIKVFSELKRMRKELAYLVKNNSKQTKLDSFFIDE
ncbi:17045_t:CDS:2, partial [Dentiscutata heterogama]